MQIGDMNIANAIINLELSVQMQGKLLEYLLNNNQLMHKPSQSQIDSFRKECQEEIKSRYPNMGVTFSN